MTFSRIKKENIIDLPAGGNCNRRNVFNAMTNDKEQNRAAKQEAFEAIMSQYEAPLLRHAARLLNGDVHAAQDVVQEVFIRLFERWTEETRTDPKLSHWLFSVTHNCSIDYVRRESRRQKLHQHESEEQEQTCQPEVGKTISEEAEKAMKAMSSLDLRERHLVSLKVFEEKSYREISEITGLTTANVGYLLHQAMKKMAAALKKEKAI